MINSSMTDSLFHERLRGSSTPLLMVGLAMAALFVAAIVFPMISTVVTTLLVGGALLLSGGSFCWDHLQFTAPVRSSARFCSACSPSRWARS